MNTPLPIIRFEVEGIRRTLLVALTEYQAQMDADLQAAVEEFCKPENLNKVIQGLAMKAIETSLRDEVDNFFRFGGGRKVIAEAVQNRLLKNIETE